MHYKVSFIIPYFNAGATIQDTIDSIYNQTYPNYDIWIVNDGSTDPQSLEKLKTFENKERITIIHQENAGPSVARNTAIKKTTTDFILPLDADNTIIEGALNHFIGIAKENADYDAFHGDMIFFGEKNSYFQREEYNSVKSILVSQIDTCALIRKKVFDNGLEYDVHLSKLGLEDWEFWINFHRNQFKSKYIRAALFNMRVGYSSRTYQVANKNLKQIKEYIYKKHAPYIEENYEKIYHELKYEKNSIDKKIGGLILNPYRFLKKLIKK